VGEDANVSDSTQAKDSTESNIKDSKKDNTEISTRDSIKDSTEITTRDSIKDGAQNSTKDSTEKITADSGIDDSTAKRKNEKTEADNSTEIESGKQNTDKAGTGNSKKDTSENATDKTEDSIVSTEKSTSYTTQEKSTSTDSGNDENTTEKNTVISNDERDTTTETVINTTTETVTDTTTESLSDTTTEITVEPTTEMVSTYTCVVSIRCDTILNNMDMLDSSKTSCVPSNGCILPETTVEFQEGDTVFDILQQVTRSAGIQMEYTYTAIYGSVYIEGINNLYEFDCGELSGWEYSVNGSFPGYGCSKYVLSDGDVIKWVYTCDLGADIGNYYGN
jgi:hypothetical protein